MNDHELKIKVLHRTSDANWIDICDCDKVQDAYDISYSTIFNRCVSKSIRNYKRKCPSWFSYEIVTDIKYKCKYQKYKISNLYADYEQFKQIRS